MRVPLIDLPAQYASLREEIMRAIQAVCDTQRFILGPQVGQLEETIAAFAKTRHAIGVSSGTDALLVSLMALGIGDGDEVITTPYSFFATAGSISRLGARPVFVDVEPRHLTLDPQRVAEEAKRRRPRGGALKAVIPVHLFGRCAAMGPIIETAKRHELAVVEDAAQALGASDADQPAGSMGAAGCLSFFPTKNLGGFGDGGMVVTSDARLAERVRLLRNHGSQPKYHHPLIGGNFRLDELQAAVLLVKFRHLERWNATRRERAAYYESLCQQHGLLETIALPSVQDAQACTYHQYVIRTPKRDALRAHLAAQGIDTEVYYPVPLHLQPCYRDLGYRPGDCPEAERASRETLALPIYPELQPAQQEYVVDAVAAFFRS